MISQKEKKRKPLSREFLAEPCYRGIKFYRKKNRKDQRWHTWARQAVFYIIIVIISFFLYQTMLCASFMILFSLISGHALFNTASCQSPELRCASCLIDPIELAQWRRFKICPTVKPRGLWTDQEVAFIIITPSEWDCFSESCAGAISATGLLKHAVAWQQISWFVLCALSIYWAVIDRGWISRPKKPGWHCRSGSK